MTRAELDRLGDRLRLGVTAEDLTALDSYRRSFRSAYDAVVDRIRNDLSLEVSGRPAKSTAAIVDKLRRSTMRLTQMQDIAGCRTVVSDVAHQSQLVGRLENMFDLAIIDRRARPSNGYRAVHAIVRTTELPVEIQVRTDLQHAWAELSEKLADNFGIELKYGGGPPEVRRTLDDFSSLIANFENHLGIDGGHDERILQLKHTIRATMINLSSALRKES